MTADKHMAIEFEARGETYSLKLGFAAIIKLEEAFDRNFQAVFTEVLGNQTTRLADLLTFFHASLLSETSNGERVEDVTRDEALAIIEEVGFEKITELLMQAIEESPLLQGPKKEKPAVRGAGPGKRKKAA